MMTCEFKITVIVENTAEPPFQAEHGVSLLIEYGKRRILFDCGAGGVLAYNAGLLGIELDDLSTIVLSHGHNDHTGGISLFKQCEIWCVTNVEAPHYSLHHGQPVHNISMPDTALASFNQQIIHRVQAFTEFDTGIWLTGPIPRLSGEDTGGPFYCDPDGICKDSIPDEQAMLLDDGILIQGCCHSGIINTMEYCHREHPEIAVHTVIGGLHLLHADEERLYRTAEYLRQTKVERLYLMHCTGDNAVEFFRKALPYCKICTPHTGDIISPSFC